MARASLADEIAAVCGICRQLGLGDIQPIVLKAAHHTSFLLSPLRIVARVQSSEASGVSLDRALRELAVVRHLAGRGAPVLAPLEEKLAGPHVAASTVVTMWPYEEQVRAAGDADAMLAASTLASVHESLRGYAGRLPPYTQALDRCWRVLADDGASVALSRDDRDLLRAHYRRLREKVEATAGPWVPLHGDAHLGNLLLGRSGPVWVDFEDACLGPRETDIAGLPCTAWLRFGDADQAQIRRCADLTSVCVAIWCWADVARSDEVREAAEYHLGRVRGLPY